MTNHLHFIPIEIQHRPIFLPYLMKSSQTCDRVFANLFCWQHHFHTEWTETDGWLVIRAYINGDRRAAYLALSQAETPDYTGIIPLLQTDAGMLDLPLTLMGLSESECETLKRQCPDQFLFDKNRDFADYIYQTDDLRSLKGRKYAQKRNHVNKFKSLYSFHYEPITDENIDDCLSLEEAWMTQHGTDESAQAEYATIRNAFRHFKELDLTGGILYIDNQVAAFTYGSAINPKLFCTHVEKGDIRYEGVYQMINFLFAQHLPESYTHINREEDMGLPGLRKSKMSYEPKELLFKTTALKLTDKMRDIIYIWGRCFGESDQSVFSFLSRYYFAQYAIIERIDNRPASMVFMIPCQTRFGMAAYLYGIATDPEFQGQGVCTRLVRRMLERCRELGASFSFLIPADPGLEVFYRRFGYETTQTTAEFRCDMDLGTGEKEKDRILVLPLDNSFRKEDLPEVLECDPML